jgi:hypothetical protein
MIGSIEISTKNGLVEISSSAYISKTNNTELNTSQIKTKGILVIKNV